MNAREEEKGGREGRRRKVEEARKEEETRKETRNSREVGIEMAGRFYLLA